jgi:hypothetical protein
MRDWQDGVIESLVADELMRRNDILTKDEALEIVRVSFPHADERDLDRALDDSTTARRNGSFVTW